MPTVASDTYAARLRKALDREGWSQLRLVRELAKRTGNAADSERSAVRGYLKGNTPRPDRARMIAEITGLPDLAVVEDPRRSASARLDDRLESIEAMLRHVIEFQTAAAAVLGELLDRLDAEGEAPRRRSSQ